MKITAIAICCAALAPAAPSAAQDVTATAPVVGHLGCPAEVDLPPEVFRDRHTTSDHLAHLRFCGVEGVRIPKVGLNWNPAALDVRFEIVAPLESDIEIRLGARVLAATGLEISSQSRTFEVRAGTTKKHSLRLSRSTKWLQAYGERLQLVVFEISPS